MEPITLEYKTFPAPLTEDEVRELHMKWIDLYTGPRQPDTVLTSFDPFANEPVPLIVEERK